LICEDLPDLPRGTYDATGQLFMGKIPIICGGGKSECNCQIFQDGLWNFTPDLRECRIRSTDSATLTNSDGKEVFILIGGRVFNNDLNTVETFDGAVWNNYYIENRPEPGTGSCSVKINSSTILSIGGFNGSSGIKNTYFYNGHLNKWISHQIRNVVVVVQSNTNQNVELLFLNDDYGIEGGWFF